MKEQGFTIVEMILVIFIISVAIVGIYGTFSLIIILNSDAVNKFQATYLSQEGIEIVRNIRDTNWITNPDPAGWMFGLADEDTDCSSGCRLDYLTDPLTDRFPIAWVGDGDYLNIDANGFYSYEAAGSTPTKFKRKITIETLADEAVKVTAQTMWTDKPSVLNPSGAQQSVTVEEVLYNWY